MELILVPNDVELNNDRVLLILVPNHAVLINDRVLLILVPKHVELNNESGVVGIGTKTCRIK